MRKFGFLATSTSLIFVLSGCGINNPESKAIVLGADSIEKGCVLYTNKRLTDAYVHFGKAARVNPEWLPVAQAASILNYGKSTPIYSKMPEISLNAIALIDGLCHK